MFTTWHSPLFRPSVNCKLLQWIKTDVTPVININTQWSVIFNPFPYILVWRPRRRYILKTWWQRVKLLITIIVPFCQIMFNYFQLLNFLIWPFFISLPISLFKVVCRWCVVCGEQLWITIVVINGCYEWIVNAPFLKYYIRLFYILFFFLNSKTSWTFS